MSYHIDDSSISLPMIMNRIAESDLVPSRESLRDGIDAKFESLENHGIRTLADLRRELNTTRRREALAHLTGLNPDYLVLLRREVEGYFPKPCPLRDLDWISAGEIAEFESVGIQNTAMIRDGGYLSSFTEGSSGLPGIAPDAWKTIVAVAELVRIQWVSPTFARTLVVAGYDTVAVVAAAEPCVLEEAIARVNAERRYFKGRIGLRDVRRLIASARFLIQWDSAASHVQTLDSSPQ